MSRLWRRVGVLLLWMCLPLAGRSVVRNVQPAPGSLQQAIKVAVPGDTLMVQPGVYKEHDILIDKKLTLIGRQYPVIDGERKYQLIVIAADSVTIQGFQLTNTGRSSMTDMAGIRVQEARHVTIRQNRVLNTTYGVYLQQAAFCTVRDNYIRAEAKDELNSGNGIHAWKSADLQIVGNQVSGHRDGIYFEFVTASAIRGNQSSANIRYGLHFMFSHNDTYTGNVFANNGAGVAVMYTKNVTMVNNTFLHNWGDAAYAILLKEISDSRIEGNRFLKNTVGIYMEGSNRIRVLSNVFHENGWAIKVTASCDNNAFERNNFTANSFDVATNGTMMLNKFAHNYWDKYEGYDMDRNGKGDVPYYPVSVYAVVTEKIPVAMILYRSFLTNILDQAEKVMPSIIPDQLKDDAPVMKKWKL